jgi:hypothetical protein
MNPERKWRRYTRFGDIFVNLQKFKQNQTPTGTGCVEWAGARHRQNYGMVGVLDAETGLRKMTVAHRVAMRIKLGRGLITGEDVRHSCGNNLCCNPSHLYIRPPKDSINEHAVEQISAL